MRFHIACIFVSITMLRVVGCNGCNGDPDPSTSSEQMGKIKFATIANASDTLRKGDTVIIGYQIKDTFTAVSGAFLHIQSISSTNGIIDAYKSSSTSAWGFNAYDGFLDNQRYGDGGVNASIVLPSGSPFKNAVRFVVKDTGYYFFDLGATVTFNAATDKGKKYVGAFIDFTNADCHLNPLRTTYPNLGGLIDDHATRGIGLYSFYVKP